MGGHFRLTDENERLLSPSSAESKFIHILWNRDKESVRLEIDGIPVVLESNQLTSLTYLQKIGIPKVAVPLTIFSFNREFYCIHTHDEEVSCNGIIFFGAQSTPIMTLSEAETEKYETLYQVFREEFATRDNIQGEMLRMLLKRLIIKTTRLAKEQRNMTKLGKEQSDLLRKFNSLVDVHYKEKRQVADYAELLFKSPKTLANVFAKQSDKTPLQIIHERIILEAKRQLLYTPKTVKEIAHELGFDEVASFHKMFRKVTSRTPQQFKQEQASPNSR